MVIREMLRQAVEELGGGQRSVSRDQIFKYFEIHHPEVLKKKNSLQPADYCINMRQGRNWDRGTEPNPDRYFLYQVREGAYELYDAAKHKPPEDFR